MGRCSGRIRVAPVTTDGTICVVRRAGVSPLTLTTRALAVLVLAVLVLFGSQANGVFADDPDEDLPPGTITNFRAESNQPYGYYVSWDTPTPLPSFIYLEWTSLANDNWSCRTPGCPNRHRPPSGWEYLSGTTTSFMVPDANRRTNYGYANSIKLQALYRTHRGYWKGPWVGSIAWNSPDRPGVLVLDEPTPRVNHAVPATIRDTHGARDKTWQWSRGDTAAGPFTEIPGANDGTYFPTTDDLGKYLKLDATYKDSNVRDEFPEITPIKTLSVVSDDPVSLYTRTLVSSMQLALGNEADMLPSRGEPNLSQPFRTGPQPEGYMIKNVEVQFMQTPDYDPDKFELKITTSPDVTEESTVATLINPGRIGIGEITFRAPLGTWLAPGTTYFLAMLHHDSVHDGHYNVRCAGEERLTTMSYAGTGWEVGSLQFTDARGGRFGSIALQRDGTATVDDDRRFLYRLKMCRIRITGEALRDVPFVTEIDFTGSQVNSPTYDTGETIELTATFSEAVTVDTANPPHLTLTIGGHTRQATYHAAGSSGKKIGFRYTVVAADRDDDGISIAEDALTGRILRADSTMVVAATEHPERINDLDHLVNAVPTLISASITSEPRTMRVYSSGSADLDNLLEGYYSEGDELEFTLLFNMPVNVSGVPRFKFEIYTNPNWYEQRHWWQGYTEVEYTPFHVDRRATYNAERSDGRQVVFTYTIGSNVHFRPTSEGQSGGRRHEQDLDGIDFGDHTQAIELSRDDSVRDGIRPNATTTAVLTLADPDRFTRHMIDALTHVSKFEVTSDPRSGWNSRTYGAGEKIHFAIETTRPVRRKRLGRIPTAYMGFRLFQTTGNEVQSNLPDWFNFKPAFDYSMSFLDFIPRERFRVAFFNPELSTRVNHASQYKWYTRLVFTYVVQSTDRAPNGLSFPTNGPLQIGGADYPQEGDSPSKGNNILWLGPSGDPLAWEFQNIPTLHVHNIKGSLDPYADPEFPDADRDGVPDPVTLSVDEFTTGPVELGSMGATDASEDRLTFTLSGADRAAFLDAFTFETVGATSTVHLREGVTLDHEAKSSYTVTVGVSDGKDDNADTEDVPTVDATVAADRQRQQPRRAR